MKIKIKFLFGIVLGLFMGLAIVFLCLPFITKNTSFLLGFIACLTMASFGFLLTMLWNNTTFSSWIFKNSTTKENKNAIQSKPYLWILVFVIFILVGCIGSIMIFKLNELFEDQKDFHNKYLGQQSEMIESNNKSGLIFLISNILDKVDYELKNNSMRTLSDATIARIAALSHSLEPGGYSYLEGDSLSEKKFSHERGHLLLALCYLGIDSSSFNKIKAKATFAGADLEGAHLQGVDLSGANLVKANLRGANLNGANLDGSDLRGANMWGANLIKADLKNTAMNRIDLRWADLDEADMRNAVLKGSDLRNAKLRNADLRGIVAIQVKMSGALLNDSDLEDSSFARSIMRKTNFSRANLSHSDLRNTDLSKAILYNANLCYAQLHGAGVEEANWLSQLISWRILGGKEIQEQYKILEGDTGETLYLLEKIEN